MSCTFGVDLRKRLIEELNIDPDCIEGCTQEEIEHIMTMQGVTFLPELYWQFLLIMGKNTGIFRGEDWDCKALPSLKEVTQELLDEIGNPFVLPDDAFVFHSHQGYVFHYFRTDKREDDPAVYFFMEGDEKPNKKWNKLSEYYHGRIDHRRDARKKRRSR